MQVTWNLVGSSGVRIGSQRRRKGLRPKAEMIPEEDYLASGGEG